MDKQRLLISVWTLETFLRCFIADQPRQWLPWAEYWYNTNFHVSAGTTPFESVYGRSPPVLGGFLPGEVIVEAVLRELKDWDESLMQLKWHLQWAQQMQADCHRTDRVFDIEPWHISSNFRQHREFTLFFTCPCLRRLLVNGNYDVQDKLPPELEGNTSSGLEPSAVLASRTVVHEATQFSRF
ncbi:putative gypsy/Ty3 element polyprotein [Trifolium pratense]|uniref:Putative gypsy/Ty3 element polyprotein n=1 Tax=Trifolium pratense TaxID=57577 RepID=A0A2K3MZY4_TRIPR|nr:putative gypsy/Ty3 element polyprotein [Trifolium pratense]